MQLVSIEIAKNYNLELAVEELEKSNFQIAYTEEDQDKNIIHLFAKDLLSLNSFGWADKIYPHQMANIDWDLQWQQHCPDYQNGQILIDLKKYGAKEGSIILKPGPGFGNLSHPTTNICLELLVRHIDKANIILDIGAGSGILALAAARISHRPVYAIDIDPTAVDHSKFNTNLNQLEHLVTNSEKIPPLTEPGAVLICLNMISSEQKIALAKNLSIIQQSSYIISSGILESDKESYLTWMSSLGWQAAETTCQDGWAAFFLTPITR